MTVKNIAAALTAFVVVFLLVFWARTTLESEYRTFTSPDGRFKIVVKRSRQWLGVMPGQASDAAGNIYLYESATGRLLERKYVDMVQIVEHVTWSSTNVDIKFVVDWKLPIK